MRQWPGALNHMIIKIVWACIIAGLIYNANVKANEKEKAERLERERLTKALRPKEVR